MRSRLHDPHARGLDRLAALTTDSVAPAMNAHVRPHNVALRNYRHNRDLADATELRILDLLTAVDAMVAEMIDDGYAKPYLADLIRGFRGLLNENIGDLAGGILDEWAADACRRLGLDPDQIH